jgi:hypothetical protein
MRLRAQRRDARAGVLRWSRVVVPEEEVEGRSSRKEHGPRGGSGSVKRGRYCHTCW